MLDNLIFVNWTNFIYFTFLLFLHKYLFRIPSKQVLLLVYGNELVVSVLGSLSLVRRKASENEDIYLLIFRYHLVMIFSYILLLNVVKRIIVLGSEKNIIHLTIN